MTPRVVVPDTNILLAVGFGEAVDSQEPTARAGLAEVREAGVPIIVPPSVVAELERKLAQVDSVYEFIRAILARLGETRLLDNPLLEAERLLRSVDVGLGVPRFSNAVRRMVADTITESPSAPLESVFAHVAGRALLMKEAIRVRSRLSYAEYTDYPEVDTSQFDPVLPGVSADDRAHLRSAAAVAERRDATAIFLTLERPLQAAADEASKLFPRVVVTSPFFLRGHLAQGQHPTT